MSYRLPILVLVLVLASIACTGGGEGLPNPCPVRQVLTAECSCGGEVFAPDARPTVCEDDALLEKPIPPATRAGEAELCSGLDDNLDGGLEDDREACAALCDPERVAELAAELNLPASDSHTVPQHSDAERQLTGYTEVPAWCFSQAAGGPDTLDVGCGEILRIGSEGLDVGSLRVAPGGVVRVEADATIAVADTLLVCPGGVIEAGGAHAVSGDAQDGSSLMVIADVFLHFGRIGTRGGQTGEYLVPARVGDSGSFTLRAVRWLFAGTIDTSAREHFPGYGEPLDGGELGEINVLVTVESFIGGAILAGGGGGGDQLGCGAGGIARGGPKEVVLDVPVCCHTSSPFELGGGSGGAGGVLEDELESPEPVPWRRGDEVFLALCDAEDLYLLEGFAGEWARMEFDPDPYEDIDLALLDLSGVVVARSEGVTGTEAVELPEDGTFVLRVHSPNAIEAPGGYTLSFPAPHSVPR